MYVCMYVCMYVITNISLQKARALLFSIHVGVPADKTVVQLILIGPQQIKKEDVFDRSNLFKLIVCQLSEQ